MKWTHRLLQHHGLVPIEKSVYFRGDLMLTEDLFIQLQRVRSTAWLRTQSGALENQ